MRDAEIPLATPMSIRQAGFDEYWLQSYICNSPARLGLGELEVVAKERIQSTGGRLDILLKSPDDNSMYEVEVMLGETDETHIIRTIEYWDNEKRRWPQRQHTAVLVAERINRRFFNVIHLLSNSIPIIAIQVSLLEQSSQRSLFFSTILDTYEETDDGLGVEDRVYDRDYWNKHSKWTTDTADQLLASVADLLQSPSLKYLKYYISLTENGRNRMWLHKRSAGKSTLGFNVPSAFVDETSKKLDDAGMTYVLKARREFVLTVDQQVVQKNPDVFRSLIEWTKQ
jgi:hypothetical protein